MLATAIVTEINKGYLLKSQNMERIMSTWQLHNMYETKADMNTIDANEALEQCSESIDIIAEGLSGYIAVKGEVQDVNYNVKRANIKRPLFLFVFSRWKRDFFILVENVLGGETHARKLIFRLKYFLPLPIFLIDNQPCTRELSGRTSMVYHNQFWKGGTQYAYRSIQSGPSVVPDR